MSKENIEKQKKNIKKRGVKAHFLFATSIIVCA